ncbi:hypothetical protein NHP20013_12990 [Helicobacter bizzozeronii]|nr:hypothetical protein NHP20013_12990 [Helicobacter bizzozeronii]
MGYIASINFKPTKLSIQEKHNDRSVKPSYVLESGGLGIECNRNATEARALRDSLVEQAKINYKQHFNQPFKAKADRYLWSAVVNIKPDTTMQDLEWLVSRFAKRYKFQCYQIAIHRDEGHIDDDGIEHINHHAHLEFVTLHPITGKSMYRKQYITYRTACHMQKFVAILLKMQRGQPKYDVKDYQGNVIIKGSGAKRIEPRTYGALMEKEKVKRIALDKSNTQEITAYQEQIKSLKTSAENTQRELHALKQGKTDLEQAHSSLQQAHTTLTQGHKALKDHSTELEATLIDLASLVAPQDKQGTLTIKEAKPLLESVRKQMITINQVLGDLKLFTQEDYKALRALKDDGLSIADLKAGIATIEQEAKTRYQALQEQYKEYCSPQQVEATINTTKALYKDYLSPSAVQELKQEHAQELELREQSHTEALEAKDTEHTRALQEK